MYLGFKIYEDTYHFFSISANNVVLHTVVGEECSCAQRSCLVKNFFASDSRKAFTSGIAAGTLSLAASSTFKCAQPFQHMAVIFNATKCGLLSDNLYRASSAYVLYKALTSNAPFVPLDANNVPNLYAQFYAAAEHGVFLLHQSVTGVSYEESSFKKLPSWMTVAPPSADEFKVPTVVWHQVLRAAFSGDNLLILGPSGCGKTDLCLRAADRLGYECVAFNFGAMSEPRSSLIGNTHFSKDKGTWFQESRFVGVLREGGKKVILLDELSRAGKEAFNILIPLLDHQKYLALDEEEDVGIINRPTEVAFFATANVGMEYTGAEAIDKALKDRFSAIIRMEFLSVEEETEVLTGRTSVDKASAIKLAKVAAHQRQLYAGGEFEEAVSTRMLLAASKQIKQGMPWLVAVTFCLANHFSDEGGDISDRAKFLQLVQKGSYE